MAHNSKRRLSRNACTDCRSRKAKCVFAGQGKRCERCTEHELDCSYVMPPRATHRNNISFESASSTYSPVNTQDPSSYVGGGGFLSYSYHRNGLNGGHDIGAATAMEILREGELAHDLILLYFNNFDDIHFMFDKEAFLRQLALGEVPKVILYSIMALGIRYSNLGIFENVPPSHRGESLHREARRLLKEEYDHPSLTTIQAYMLASTYHLTFGGARKAWIHLGMASSLCKILRLCEEPSEPDPFKKELNIRLLNTVALMDCTLSPSLNMPCYFSPTETIPKPCSDDELCRIRIRAAPATLQPPSPNLVAEILRLARDFREICLYHRTGGTVDQWVDMERRHKEWPVNISQSLHYTLENFALHRSQHTLRRFLYIHLLHHHIGQLIYFSYLDTTYKIGAETGALQLMKCQQEAAHITEIVHSAWTDGGLDVHNASIGQILMVAAAVHLHTRLTAGSTQPGDRSQAGLVIINSCLTRIKEHCRIFDRVSAQLDTFVRICSQSSSSSKAVFDKNNRLIRQILHYGTAYERLNYRNAGRNTGIEASASGTNSPPQFTMPPANVPVLSVEYLDWLATNVDSSGASFDNYAWMFSDASLNDLYSMSFVDSSSSLGTESDTYRPSFM